MNKLYAGAVALSLIAMGAQAQQVGSPVPNTAKLQHDHTVQTPVKRATPTLNADRETYFSEDFANGLAGNNGLGAWTLDGANGNVWRHTYTGPVGAYSNPVAQALASATADNGWMIFNSDSANTNWNVDPPAIVGSPVNLIGGLISPVIDLSANPNVEVRVTQGMRWCCAGNAIAHHLDVSVDGGQTWNPDNSFEMTVVSGNTLLEATDFAAVIRDVIIDDPSNVRLRFRHDATGVSHYYWQLDDVMINAVPEHELIMDYGFLAQYGLDAPRVGGMEYHRVPQNQLLDEVEVGAGIINYGYGDQTNVQVNISLRDAEDIEVASETLNIGDMAGGESVDVSAWMTIPSPLPVGAYACHFTMTSDNIGDDNNPNNNSAIRYITSSDGTYSQDGIDVMPSEDLFLGAAGTNSFTDNTQDVRLLTYYQINEPTLATGVEIYLSNGSAAGSFFIGAIYDTADIFLGIMDSPLAETDFRFITEEETTSRIVFAPLMDNLELQPGGYYISANMYQEDGNDMRILDDLTVPQPAWASALWIPVDDEEVNLYGGNGNAWAVRLTTNFGTGVQETPTLPGVKMYPNPNDGQFRVEVEKGGNLTVEVFNTLGELVHTSQFSGVSTQLDLSNQAIGIYTVRVGDGTNYHMQRVAVK